MVGPVPAPLAGAEAAVDALAAEHADVAWQVAVYGLRADRGCQDAADPEAESGRDTTTGTALGEGLTAATLPDCVERGPAALAGCMHRIDNRGLYQVCCCCCEQPCYKFTQTDG